MSKNKIPAKATKDTQKKFIIDEKSKKELKPEKSIGLSELDNKWNMNNKILELFSTNIEKDQNLKEKYAIALIIILGIQLVALIAIFVLKGCNVLNYSDSTFNIFITGGIAEVFILVRVIVKYLFTDNLTDALKIILESNNKGNLNKNKNNFNKKSDKSSEN